MTSRNIFKKKAKVEFKNSLVDNGFKLNVCEKSIPTDLQEKFDDIQKKNGTQLPWTEGLFRYHSNEICGIVINNEIDKAKDFQFKIGKQIPFYKYDPTKHKFIKQ